MEYKTTTATAAVLHFSEHGFRPAFKGKTGKDNPDYFRAVQIIKSAKGGEVSDDRARWLLENYGGEMYRVESRFEVAVPDANGPAFKAALEKIWAENEGEETETKI